MVSAEEKVLSGLKTSDEMKAVTKSLCGVSDKWCNGAGGVSYSRSPESN